MITPLDAAFARIRQGDAIAEVARDLGVGYGNLAAAVRAHESLSGERLPRRPAGRPRGAPADILRLHEDGLRPKAIARMLGMSPITIRAHIRRFRKLAAEAAQRAAA